MKVFKNYLYNLAYQIFILIVPLITIPYVSRVLGPKGIGINTLTNSVIQYFVLFATLGLTVYGQREIAYKRSNKDELSKTFWEIEFLSIITTIISIMLFTIFLLFSKQYTFFYFCQSFLILACAADISWFFVGLELFKLTVLRNFIFKVISIVCVFTLVKSSDDLYIYILIISFSSLFGNLSLWPYLTKYVKKVQFKALNIFRHLRSTLALFIPQIAINVYVYLNKIMLAHLSTVVSAGFFDSSDKIIRMGLTVVSALTTVMLPRVADAFSKGEKSKVELYLRRSFQVALAIAIPLMMGLIAISPIFVPWFFGEKFTAVTSVLMVEAIAIIPIACSQLLGMQYLVPTKMTNIYTVAIISGAIINFVVNIPLIYFYSAIGTAIATVISESFIALFELYYVSKKVEISKLFNGVFKIFGASIVMFVLVKSLTIVLPLSILTLGIEIALGMCVYCFLLYVFRFELLTVYSHKIFEKFDRKGR